MVRAAVESGRYSDPAAEKLLGDVLIERRKKIVAAYIPAVNPLIDFSLSNDGRLRFRNAAVDLGVGTNPQNGYTANWADFDNASGQAKPLGAATTSLTTEIAGPAALTSVGPFIKVQVAAIAPARPEWSRPVDVYFRRAAGGWQLVGLERP